MDDNSPFVYIHMVGTLAKLSTRCMYLSKIYVEECIYVKSVQPLSQMHNNNGKVFCKHSPRTSVYNQPQNVYP